MAMEVDFLNAFQVGSKMDTKKLVSTLVDAEVSPLQSRVDSRKTKTEAQISGLATLKSTIESLRLAFTTLDDNREFNFAKISSADTSIVGVESGSGVATAGNHSVIISALAQQEIRQSDAASSKSADQNSNSAADFVFTVNSSQYTVSLSAGEVSLNNLASGINDITSTTGVSARVVTTATDQYRLLLEGQSGSTNAITIDTSILGLGTTSNKLQSVQDASFTVNGLAITSSTNKITDVIPGVSLNLSATTNSAVNVNITRDMDLAKETIKTVVSAVDLFESTLKKLSNSVDGDLANDSSVIQIKNKIKELFYSESSKAGTNIKSIMDMGVSYDRSGNLIVNDVDLDTALSTYFDEIKDFFSGGTDDHLLSDDSARGVAGDMVKLMDEYLGYDGTIKTLSKQFTTVLSQSEDEQIKVDDRKSVIEERYTKQFAAMNQIMAEMNSLKEYLDNQLSNLPNNNKD